MFSGSMILLLNNYVSKGNSTWYRAVWVKFLEIQCVSVCMSVKVLAINWPSAKTEIGDSM